MESPSAEARVSASNESSDELFVDSSSIDLSDDDGRDKKEEKGSKR